MAHTGTRQTRQRKLILELLRSTKSHPTADWLYDKARERIPKISLGTVYRNLGVLKSQGLVREINGVDRSAHFDGDVSPHAHFFCSQCGKIRDVFSLTKLEEQSFPELEGCEIHRQEVELIGLCPQCRRKQP